jgi:pilus assembly protein CpaE
MTTSAMSLPDLTIDAFCVSGQGEALLHALRQDERAARSVIRAHDGGIEAAIELYSKAESPNLLVIEQSDQLQAEDLINALDRLAPYCDAGTHLVLLGPANDIRFYQRLMALGISEYVTLPASEDEFIAAIIRAFGAGQENVARAKVVGVFGATGGCGASSLARILAQFLGEREGRPSILIDLDAPFGSVGFAFGVEADEADAQALQTPGRMDRMLLERLLKQVHKDLHVLPAPGLSHLHTHSLVEVERLVQTARLMTSFVILDLPHGFSPQIERLWTICDEIALVAPPTLLGLRHAKAICDKLTRKPALILNQVNMRRRDEVKAIQFQDVLGIPAMAEVNFDPSLFVSAETEASTVFRTISQRKARPFLKLLEAYSPQQAVPHKFVPPAFNLLRRAFG